MSIKREIRKREIMESALKIFGSKGFYKATMEEIALDVGIGKATIYEYFSSKKDLFQEMLIRMVETYLKGAKSIIKTKNNTRDKLIAYTKYHGEYIEKHMDVAETLVMKTDNLSDEIKQWLIEANDKLYCFILEIVDEGIKKGEIKKDIDKELATLIIIGSISQIYGKKVYFSKLKADEIDPIPIINMLFEGFTPIN